MDGGIRPASERDIIHKVPESITGYTPAIIEPLACAVHTVERGKSNLRCVSSAALPWGY